MQPSAIIVSCRPGLSSIPSATATNVGSRSRARKSDRSKTRLRSAQITEYVNLAPTSKSKAHPAVQRKTCRQASRRYCL